MQLNLLHSDPDLIYEIFHSNCIVTAKGEGELSSAIENRKSHWLTEMVQLRT